VRNSFQHALRGEAASISEARVIGAVFALSSVLTPFFLGCALGAVASGQVPAEGDPGTGILLGVAAIATPEFLAGDRTPPSAPGQADALDSEEPGA
jgi:cytochrome d ubiquinol oxidase subunit II